MLRSQLVDAGRAWNQCRPLGADVGTSSSAVVPIVEKGKGNACPCGRTGDCRFTFVVHQPGEACGCEYEWKGTMLPEHDGRGVDIRYVLQDARAKGAVSICISGIPDAHFLVCGTVDTVEDRAGCPLASELT